MSVMTNEVEKASGTWRPRFEPVRWATGALALLTAVLGANELIDQLGFPDIIPSRAIPYLLLAEAVLALLLGKVVRDRVTPLARPRDGGERPLLSRAMAIQQARDALRRHAGYPSSTTPSRLGSDSPERGATSWRQPGDRWDD